MILTKDMSKSEDGKNDVEDKPERIDVGVGVYGNVDCVGRVVVVIISCPTEADIVEGVANPVL